MAQRIDEITRTLVEDQDGRISESTGDAHFRHYVLDLTPQVQASKLICSIKTVTSRLIRKEFAEHTAQFFGEKPVFWARSYCIFSVGPEPDWEIKRFLANVKSY